MASLFDIAATLTQYDDASLRGDREKLASPPPESVLGILDETLQVIYDTRSLRPPSKLRPPSASAASTPPGASRLSQSKSAEALSARLHQLSSAKAIAPAPAFVLPPPPAAPKAADSDAKQQRGSGDPDLAAKAVLREVTDEVEQLLTVGGSSADADASLLRMLTTRYVDARLETDILVLWRACWQSKLPGTPFVLLVRKKVAQKLEQLELRLRSRRKEAGAAKEEENSTSNNSKSDGAAAAPSDTAPWQRLRGMTSVQREVLQNLLRLPEKQLLKLPRAQLELVQFAKRYDKLLKATPDELRRLPVEHQQLVRRMQQQQQLKPASPRQ
ncbi:hypothetical protein BBJ28_00012854 [Nothophytophthora sp. Chile5]|nr:hypothetical protein BBJ28_00012854 [Nothophytophthora sp. Chile5]